MRWACSIGIALCYVAWLWPAWLVVLDIACWMIANQQCTKIQWDAIQLTGAAVWYVLTAPVFIYAALVIHERSEQCNG